jgi:CheY-like chemotaxis protein
MSEAVLVLDDDPFIRRLITTTLEDVGQYELHAGSFAARRPPTARRS